jgi:hypothetical protein
MNVWENIKKTNICLMGVKKNKEKEKDRKHIKEDKMAENSK